MSNKTFSQFKDAFYSRINDFSTFDCAEFNILKVVLDGLHVDYVSKGKIRTPLFYPHFLYELFLFLKRIQNPSSIKQIPWSNAKVFIFNTTRAVESGNNSWVHFRCENILKHYGYENCTIVVNVPDHKLKYQYDYLSVAQFVKYKPLTNEDKKLRKDLINTFLVIQNSAIFSGSELENIKIAIQLFFDKFRIFNALLQNGEYKVAHFDAHYHHEGFMLALLRNGVLRHELQHGLIAPEDIFYVFPEKIRPIAKRALFPDKIFVFGKYWQELLRKGAEWEKDQVQIIGDYYYQSPLNESVKKEILDFKGDDKIILIATQTSLHDYFISYTLFLHDYIIKNKLPFKIILKTHPSENINTYKRLTQLSGLLHLDIPAIQLFEYCSIQISIYSTTLYEALSFEILNFSLDVDICRDYINGLIQNDVSTLLPLNEAPFGYLNTKKPIISPFYYEPFNPMVLKTDL